MTKFQRKTASKEKKKNNGQKTSAQRPSSIVWRIPVSGSVSYFGSASKRAVVQIAVDELIREIKRRVPTGRATETRLSECVVDLIREIRKGRKSLSKPENSQYFLNEWKIGNRATFDLVDGDCSKCESLLAESLRLRTDLGNKLRQVVQQQFDLRLSDMEFWRVELNKKVAKTGRKVIVHRDARKGNDLVVSAIYTRTIEEIDEQKRANRSVSNNVLRDMEDKFTTINIDFSAQARNPDIGKPLSLKFNDELLRTTHKVVTLADWESWTVHNVERSDNEIRLTDKFRPLIEQILCQMYKDLDLQRRKTLKALHDRIDEVLEGHLSRITKRTMDQKSELGNLNMSHDDAMNRLALAQQQPRMELVWDSVQLELLLYKEIQWPFDLRLSDVEFWREELDKGCMQRINAREVSSCSVLTTHDRVPCLPRSFLPPAVHSPLCQVLPWATAYLGAVHYLNVELIRNKNCQCLHHEREDSEVEDTSVVESTKEPTLSETSQKSSSNIDIHSSEKELTAMPQPEDQIVIEVLV